MNIDHPTNSHTVSNTTLIAQTLWLGVILSIAIGIGSYALLTWGETVSQLLTATDKNFWYLSRASGIIAYTLFWLAVVFGLLLSTRLGKHFNAARVFALHQYLSLIAVGFAAFHAGVLLADNFLNLNLWQILLPFGFQTERVGVALGQLGFWILFICAFSFYIKKYIGQSAWRWLHFLTFLSYMFISIHVFMVGTDSRALPLLLFYAGSQTLVFLLMTYRLVALKKAK